MNAIGWCIRVLANGLEGLANVFTRAANLLWELVPAVLPPDRLARLVQTRYDP